MSTPVHPRPTAPEAFRFSPAIQSAVKELGYTTWTPIQEKSIPFILEGRDVIGQSHTGSGKTAAFGLPIVEKLNPTGRAQVLILVPTRELAEQVMQEMRKFAKHKRMSITPVYGGVGMGPQIHHLRRTDIVVGTPGRVLDHLDRGTFDPSQINMLVLDEADRMLDMGFIRDMRKIVQRIPTQRQTLLFSATISDEVRRIANQYMKDPEIVKTEAYVDKGKLTHAYYDLDKAANEKFSLLVHVLKTEKPSLAMVFCGTRRMVDIVERNLNENGVPAQAIHGGLSQNQRKRTLEEFHHGKFHVLVASDVAARGLDIKNVSHIINYDIPRNASEYIHRSGRTARAGEEGKMISLLAPQDYDDFRQVLRDKSLHIEALPMPAYTPVPMASKRGKGMNRPAEGQEYGHAQRRDMGRRFFAKKGRNEGRSFAKSGSFGGRPRGDGPARSPDAAVKRKPHYNDPPIRIVKHFSAHKAKKDE